MQSRRPEVRRELAVGDPAAQLGEATAAQERPRPTAGEQPVQEHGESHLLPQPLGDGQRLGARHAAARLVEEDDRRDIQRADVRVDAALGAEVDPRHSGVRALDHRVGQDARLRGERVDRAMVVAVGVRVQQPRPAAQVGGADGGDRGEITTLGDVGNGEQHEVGAETTRARRGPKRISRRSVRCPAATHRRHCLRALPPAWRVPQRARCRRRAATGHPARRVRPTDGRA